MRTIDAVPVAFPGVFLMSSKSTNIATPAGILSDRIERLPPIGKQYRELLILREKLRLAAAKVNKHRPQHAKDFDDRVPWRGVAGGGSPRSPARAGLVSWR
jgi:hypothetical protein